MRSLFSYQLFLLHISDIERYLAMQDYFPAHKDIEDEYGDPKEKLAKDFIYDIIFTNANEYGN